MAQFRILEAARICWGLLRDAFREFQKNDPLRMAAATSFFASFALPPIIIILVEVFGLFVDPRGIRREFFQQLSVVTDKNIAGQVRAILRNVHLLSIGPGLRTGGFIFLLFIATTLFEVIKNSMNQLWRIRLKDRQGIVFILVYRIKSILGIVIAGLLLFIAVLADTLGWIIQGKGNHLIYHASAMLAASAWFILILKYLCDGRPPWKMAIAGGLFTGLLFTLGELLLHLVFSYPKVQVIYGASTSLVLLLLFVFYCAFIFYYGVCFTAALARRMERPILPTRHAVNYELN